MKFIKWEDLRPGMRLARPIYNKAGVLLFERDSRLTPNAIESVRNFGLLGIYILEPAEPLPPMSEEDLAFERFEIKMVASLQAELERIAHTSRQKSIATIASQIIREYGHLDEKINFYQNLRSKDDYCCRHMFNTAILSAMIANRMNLPVDERLICVYAALVHDIGKLGSENPAIYGDESDPDQINRMYAEAVQGLEVIEDAFPGEGSAIKRICNQALRNQSDSDNGIDISGRKMVTGAKIVMVASRYDEKTAMRLNGESESEVRAIQVFLDHPEVYDPAVVRALIASVNILFAGVSVELSTGEKALVLTENRENILQPTVLSFRDNNILDLSLKANQDICVVDVMKTLDNRYVMDTSSVQEHMGVTNHA